MNSKPSVLILRAPGTNCDQETAFAFQLAGATTTISHVNEVLETPQKISAHQLLCIPGGFSYGDDIAAGRIFGTQIRTHLADAIRDFYQSDKLILGICNGFQVLLKSGILLPDEAEVGLPATLATNESGKYEDRWVNLKVSSQKSVFFQGIESLELPIAHAEGKFVTSNQAILDSLVANEQIILQYQSKDGSQTETVPYPDNPNGSQLNIAAVSDTTGRVLGLMPHPERNIDFTHHPCWTRLPKRDCGEGLKIFENAVQYFK